jgi:DNA-binding transcriptional LysR family regulator
MALPDLRKLRYFVAVAEELHFGRAAERLRISQPPLSVHIRTLERELGVQLFVRNRRRVTLTVAGNVLLEEAHRLLRQAELSVLHVRRAASGEVGRLAIGFVSTVDYSILPSLVGRFRAKHPGVDLRLLEMTGDRQQEALRTGELDLGLSILPAAASDLVTRPILREALIAAVSARHALAARTRPLDPARLEKERFIVFPRRLAPGLFDATIGVCRQAGFTPAVAQEAVQMQTILGLVAAGLGIALVPACMATLQRPDVRYLKLASGGGTVETAAQWHTQNKSPALQSLVSELPIIKATMPNKNVRTP